MDPDLRERAPLDSPDSRHETTDQKPLTQAGKTGRGMRVAQAIHIPARAITSVTAVNHGHERTTNRPAQRTWRPGAIHLPSWPCGFDSRRPLFSSRPGQGILSSFGSRSVRGTERPSCHIHATRAPIRLPLPGVLVRRRFLVVCLPELLGGADLLALVTACTPPRRRWPPRRPAGAGRCSPAATPTRAPRPAARPAGR
jgi:hypothetical protein